MVQNWSNLQVFTTSGQYSYGKGTGDLSEVEHCNRQVELNTNFHN
jgi:hypothetical protein